MRSTAVRLLADPDEDVRVVTRRTADVEATLGVDLTRVDETRAVAMIGHELRAPLATLAAAAEMLRDTASPESERMVATVNRQVRRMVWLFDAALRTTALAAGGAIDTAARADVAEVIADVTDIAADTDRRVRIETTVARSLPAARIEPEALTVILNNLIGNAMKHARANAIRVSARERIGAVTITVADDGAGVPEHLRSSMFDSGFRDSSAPGAGLGLHVSRELARRFGGDITHLESATGGAMFVLDVPADGRGA